MARQTHKSQTWPVGAYFCRLGLLTEKAESLWVVQFLQKVLAPLGEVLLLSKWQRNLKTKFLKTHIQWYSEGESIKRHSKVRNGNHPTKKVKIYLFLFSEKCESYKIIY